MSRGDGSIAERTSRGGPSAVAVHVLVHSRGVPRRQADLLLYAVANVVVRPRAQPAQQPWGWDDFRSSESEAASTANTTRVCIYTSE